MHKEKIVGHEAIENGKFVIVIKHSERPLGGLLGFVIGILIAVVLLPDILNWIQVIATIFVSTLVFYAASKGQSTREVPQQRVVRITRRRNYAAVYYVIPETTLVELPNQ